MLHVELTALFIAVKFTVIPPPVKLKCSNPCTAHYISEKKKKASIKIFLKKCKPNTPSIGTKFIPI